MADAATALQAEGDAAFTDARPAASTDVSGQYRISAVRPGRHRIQVRDLIYGVHCDSIVIGAPLPDGIEVA